MKSKEALNRLSKYIGELGGGETLEEEEVIIRDLEVLDTLKKHFQVYFDDESENGLEEKVFNGLDLDDIWSDGYDEDFKKIMEWLDDK